MENNGEHFTPTQTSLTEIEINIERYMFALKFLEGKTVLDLGCGAGLGSYLYSLVAKKVFTVDYSNDALEEAKRYPRQGNIEFIRADLRDPECLAQLPEHDVCVALEILEHIEDPGAVLKALKGTSLVFSLPLHSMEMSSWHRYQIDTEADVRKLIEPYYQIGRYEEQTHPLSAGKWIRGEGTKFES